MDNKKRARRYFLWIALLLLGSIWVINRNQDKNRMAPYQHNNGMIFGTIYKVTYQSHENLLADIEAELHRFDGSLSPFKDTSVISRVNRSEPIKVDTLFANVFRRSMEISELTQGAFDITVAPLVNAWGFGFQKGFYPDSAQVDSLLEVTGYKKIRLTKEGRVEKSDSRIMLTCSAIAKGYAVDLIAQLLEKRDVRNFMVDIGGEVVVKGTSPKQVPWRIGINKPVDDSLSTNQEIEMVLSLKQGGIATSGNYRNFYYRNGKKYAHTIDPRTGYPVQHSILSATVLARDCMTADALATSFMVMGLEEAEALAKRDDEVEAYLIYSDDQGQLQSFMTEGMKRYIAK